jgi:hypothetical protein
MLGDPPNVSRCCGRDTVATLFLKFEDGEMKKLLFVIPVLLCLVSLQAWSRTTSVPSAPQRKEKKSESMSTMDTSGKTSSGSSSSGSATGYNNCVYACDKTYQTSYAACSTRYTDEASRRGCRRAAQDIFDNCMERCDWTYNR